MVNHTEVDLRGILVWRTYTQGAVPWPQRSCLGPAVSRFPPSEKLRMAPSSWRASGLAGAWVVRYFASLDLG